MSEHSSAMTNVSSAGCTESMPAGNENQCVPDELDTPALDESTMHEARVGGSMDSSAHPTHDAFDTPAADDFAKELTAGDQLALDDPSLPWPAMIEPIRALFFSSEAIIPFESDGFVFVRAPMPEDSGIPDCLIGLNCENGRPYRICYAIPATYTPEPPAGLEGYIWRGDGAHGYWVICESVND